MPYILNVSCGPSHFATLPYMAATGLPPLSTVIRQVSAFSCCLPCQTAVLLIASWSSKSSKSIQAVMPL